MAGLFVILCVLLVVAYICSKQDIFSPGVLTAGIWLFCLLLFVVLPNRLPALQQQFLLCAGIWSGCFVLSSLSMQSLSYSNKKMQCSATIRDLYFWISIACIPALLLFVYRAIAYGTTDSIALNLRMATLGKNVKVGEDTYTPMYYILWLATYLLYLIDANKKHWKRTVILGCLTLLFGIATMSKAMILTVGIITLFVLYKRGIISTKYILIGGAAVLAMMIVLQGIRHSMSMDKEEVENIFEQYILRGFCAFDTLLPCSSSHSGENVFRIFYAISYKLGWSSIEPIDPILPWVYEPVATNTYTVMYPFFLDFGYVGVGVFAVVLGAGAGWLYKKSEQGNSFYTILYAYFCVMLVMQYVQDNFFTNLAGVIKFVLLLSLPYIVGNYQLLRKKTI